MTERILIVDDSAANRLMLAQLIRAWGCEAVQASGGQQAIDIVQIQSIDLVLLDIRMPEVDGFAVLEFLKRNEDTRHIPVIMVSSLDDLQAVVRCITLGAEDYLTKPYEPTLLRARLGASLEKRRMLQELIHLKQDLQQRNADLHDLNRRLEVLAFSDTLTGLPNRRFALQELGSHWSSSRRSGRPLSCVMVDLDHFKRYNDTYGHDTGDDVIRHAADILRVTARASDYPCRFGGEEFLVICPDTDAAGCCDFGQRILKAMSQSPITCGEDDLFVTASLGVAQREPGMENWNEMLVGADQALYEAKHAGRNCLRVYSPSVAR